MKKGFHRGIAMLLMVSLIMSGVCAEKVQGAQKTRLSEKSITVTITDKNDMRKALLILLKNKKAVAYMDVAVLKIKGKPTEKNVGFLGFEAGGGKGVVFEDLKAGQFKKGTVFHSDVDGCLTFGGGYVELSKPKGVKFLKLKFTFYTYGKNEIKKVRKVKQEEMYGGLPS